MAFLANRQPIGVFDSGVGGLTVASALARLLPNESLVYFSDTLHMPYGDKSPDAIRYYSLQITGFLLTQHCKMVVIACNTASVTAYNVLTDFFKDRVLFVNVIDPLVQVVARQRFKKVGVIATNVTTQSGVYPRRLIALQPDLKVVSLATPMLAPLIEDGQADTPYCRRILADYLSHPDFSDIDALLLACTHYPLLRPAVNDFFDGRVQIFDSTDVVALAAKQQLEALWLLNTEQPAQHKFYVSDISPGFEKVAAMLFGADITLEKKDIWKEGM